MKSLADSESFGNASKHFPICRSEIGYTHSRKPALIYLA